MENTLDQNNQLRNQSKTKIEKYNAAFANLFSYIFHPVLMPTYMTLLLVYFMQKEQIQMVFASKDVWSWVFNVFINTFFFPVIFILMLKALKFIPSIQLREQKQRIIPLIGVMVFYFWNNEVFRNIETNFLLRVLVLGGFWGIVALFLSNIFIKISMHAAGVGGAIAFIIIQLILAPSLQNILILLAVLLVAGIIGTSRLYLKAHNPKELWTGYIVGALVQTLAYLFLVYM